MSPFSLSYDRLTFTLAPFLCLLFGRNICWFLGRYSLFFLQNDTLTSQQRSCAVFSSFFALIFLFFYHSYLGIFSLGMMLFFCSLQAGFPYFRIEIFPFLMIYALYPSFGTEVILIGCLLCPLLKYINRRREEDIYFLILMVTLRLSEGLLNDKSFQIGGNFFFLLLLIMLIGSLLSFFFRKNNDTEESDIFYFIDNILLWRPLFLISFIEIAHENTLTDTIQVIYIALFIEVLLRFYRLISFSSIFLQVLIPPFPGFIILWLSIHSLVGIATVSSIWMMITLFIVCLFIIFSILETILAIGLSYKYSLLGYYSRSPLSLWGGIIIIPLFAHFITLFLTNTLPGWNDWFTWWENIYFLKGGDGAILALPILWVLFLIFYHLFKKISFSFRDQNYSQYYNIFLPWFILIQKGLTLSHEIKKSYMLKTPISSYPFAPLWYGIKEQIDIYQTKKILPKKEEFSHNITLILWLFFLAIMLILVGIEQ